MANKNKKKANPQDMFDAKIFFTKYIKRYGIVLLISFIPIVALNFLISKYVSTAVLVIIDIALLLLACFIGLVIFTKIEEKRDKNPKPKERDPFAD